MHEPVSGGLQLRRQNLCGIEQQGFSHFTEHEFHRERWKRQYRGTMKHLAEGANKFREPRWLWRHDVDRPPELLVVQRECKRSYNVL